MMSSALIVSHDLEKVRRDLNNTAEHLGTIWTASDHDSIGRLANASEALMRAVATLAATVERLAELPACDGSHNCDCS